MPAKSWSARARGRWGAAATAVSERVGRCCRARGGGALAVREAAQLDREAVDEQALVGAERKVADAEGRGDGVEHHAARGVRQSGDERVERAARRVRRAGGRPQRRLAERDWRRREPHPPPSGQRRVDARQAHNSAARRDDGGSKAHARGRARRIGHVDARRDERWRALRPARARGRGDGARELRHRRHAPRRDGLHRVVQHERHVALNALALVAPQFECVCGSCEIDGDDVVAAADDERRARDIVQPHAESRVALFMLRRERAVEEDASGPIGAVENEPRELRACRNAEVAAVPGVGKGDAAVLVLVHAGVDVGGRN